MIANSFSKQFGQTNSVWHDKKYSKIVLAKPQELSRFEEYMNRSVKSMIDHEIEVQSLAGLNLRKAIKYLQETKNYK